MTEETESHGGGYRKPENWQSLAIFAVVSVALFGLMMVGAGGLNFESGAELAARLFVTFTVAGVVTAVLDAL